MSAIGWVMIAYSSNCLISQEWLASIAEGDSIINATLLYFTNECTNVAHESSDKYLRIVPIFRSWNKADLQTIATCFFISNLESKITPRLRHCAELPITASPTFNDEEMTRNSVLSSLSLSRDCVIQTRTASTHCVIKDKALLASFVDFTLKKQYICVSSAYICSAMLSLHHI